MGQARDLQDVALEQAAGVGVGDHDGRHVRRELGLEVREVHPPVRRLGDLADLIAHESGRRRVGAVGRARHQHAPPRPLPARLVRRLDGQQAAQLPVRPRLGRQGHGGHAGQGLQPVRQAVHELQRALGRRGRLQGVQVGEARHPRRLLVQPRIVLHRARAQRIERQVDGMVLLRQPHIVAQRLGLGEARQPDRPRTHQVAQVRGVGLRLGQIDARPVRAADLEQDALVLQQPPPAPQGAECAAGARRLGLGRPSHRIEAHAPILRCRAPASAWMSPAVVVSVAASSSTSLNPSSGSSRE
jgi:hypothetical protein